MPESDDEDPFAGTAEYYASYRPGYGDDAIHYLRERFDLDDEARVLDLGCGAGQIAVPLAAYAGEVVGMDPNEAMLRQAQERAEAAGRENVRWVAGSDADLRGGVGDDLRDDLGAFRLTTMGRAFHWMEQEPTLRRIHELTEPGGGVALLGDNEWLTKGQADWQAAVYDVASGYVADLAERQDPAEIEYEKTWRDYLEASPFGDVETTTFEFGREWDADSVVGYVLSLSFCSPEVLGDDRDAFVADLRAHLADRPEDAFVEDVTVEVNSARKQA